MSIIKNRKLITTGIVAGLGLAAIPALTFATGISGDVQLNTEVATSIAMKIASPNDTNPDCMEQSGVTYGVANRYATSNGAEGSKQVDTFDGTVGGADEINTNTSCATLAMNPNAFSSTYSDITVYTNSPTGYALTVRSADNTSPNLVKTNNDGTIDPTQYILAATLTEVDGTIDDGQGGTTTAKVVPGGQNKWAIKSDVGLLDTWTPVTTTDATVRGYDMETNNGSTTRVTYGISAGNNVTGKYATTLTYTATMFDGPNPHIPNALFAGDPADPTSSRPCEGANCDNQNFNPNPTKLPVPYKETRSATIKPKAGHYIDNIICAEGYTCTGENETALSSLLGPSATSPITIYVTNNTNKEGIATINIIMKPIEYPVTISGDPANESNSLSTSASTLSIPYGSSRSVTVSPNLGYYLESYSCPEGYICAAESPATGSTHNTSSAHNVSSTRNTNSANNTAPGLFTANAYAAENEDAIQTGEEAIYAQDVKITNKGAVNGGTVSFKTAPRHFTATIDKDANLSVTEYSSSPSQNPASVSELSITYGHSKNITVTPTPGHYLASVSCPEGYVCTKTDGTTISTGDNEAGRASQNIRISNSRSTVNGTVSFTSGASEYTVSLTSTNITTTSAGTSTAIDSINIPYGGSKTLTITPNAGHYLSSYSCPEGYTCTKSDGTAISTGDNETAGAAQIIKVTNNNTLSGGSLTFTGTAKTYEVAITPSLNATTSTNSISVPYGGSVTFKITPSSERSLASVTCSSGYTCSGFTTGFNNTSKSEQTITVKNNDYNGTGAISFTTVAYMQDFSATAHASDAIGTAYTLTDSRDNTEYSATKLADNKIWMTKNLQLDGGKTLTPDDSDVTTNFSLAADNSGTWCTEYNSAACYNQSLMTKQGATNGYFYNWYTATAGTGTYEMKTPGDNATSSICPKGWKLPTGGEGGDFANLDIAYGGDGRNGTRGKSNELIQREKFRAAPLYFDYTGIRWGGDTQHTTAKAWYWSRTITMSSSEPYYLGFHADDSRPAFYPNDCGFKKYVGLVMRCIASS